MIGRSNTRLIILGDEGLKYERSAQNRIGFLMQKDTSLLKFYTRKKE